MQHRGIWLLVETLCDFSGLTTGCMELPTLPTPELTQSPFSVASEEGLGQWLRLPGRSALSTCAFIPKPLHPRLWVGVFFGHLCWDPLIRVRRFNCQSFYIDKIHNELCVCVCVYVCFWRKLLCTKILPGNIRKQNYLKWKEKKFPKHISNRKYKHSFQSMTK